MKRIASIFLIMVLVISVASVSYAQNPPLKLGRGIINVLTGIMEVPAHVIKTCKKEGAPTGLTAGLAKGLAWGIYRTLAGVYEVATFVIPLPAGYEPITEPDILLTSETLNMGDPSMRSDFSLLKDELSGPKK